MKDIPRILLVEDDALTGLLLADLLEAADFLVDGPHRTVADAMAALAHAFPDFALLDIHLEGQDSMLVADDLTQYGIDFAFFSGTCPDSAIQRRFGDALFLAKPLNPAEVIAAGRSRTVH